LRYVLASPQVTLDTIFAAIVAYQLAALAFAAIYHLIAVLAPLASPFLKLHRARTRGACWCS
jgi:hypothetical protein